MILKFKVGKEECKISKLHFYTMIPKNPECESVQDFYFFTINSSLFTKIRIQDF